MQARSVVIVGGGPAGLRAAEVASAGGAKVILCDAAPSVGRKFLVAGRGGLNLTHSETVEDFPTRYGAEHECWRDLLREFGPTELQAWAAELGIETYVGSSGRVFPRGQKAAGMLRAWVARLRGSGVQLRMGARLQNLVRTAVGWRADFQNAEGNFSVDSDTLVLALGGASWPETGSDGTWPALLAAHGIEVTPWAPANCGWNVDWPAAVLERAEGLPLKNLTVTAGAESVSGELLITRYGIEGGAVYRLGPTLRAMELPRLVLDLKPQLSSEALRERLVHVANTREWAKAVKLSPAATALVDCFHGDVPSEAGEFIARIKQFHLPLRDPRPIAEAISSAGGVSWSELDHDLMLRKLPGVFVAGEMIDWEAPTGGYLLQGCFSTGTRAGRAAATFSHLAPK
ncbi:MAG TPA: TIGR03862 family flavoprotein [Chthoniobacterales bacterium]|nr:TIGR03862 family flavoprotein [Chthoniobacterales bacterium]